MQEEKKIEEVCWPRRVEIMGVLNVTPDSFSDGGRYFRLDEAIQRGEAMLEEGADIIDIGGASSRPGSQAPAPSEERERVQPVIRELVKRNPNIRISIDTFEPEVAKAALDEGATILNDITGFGDPSMIAVLKAYGCEGVLMHMQGTPQTMQQEPYYEDLIGEVGSFFKERVARLEGEGVDRKKIILDPGIGFGKTVEHNLVLLNRLHRFKRLGQRILVGVSRKSFIGKLLNVEVGERMEGSVTAALLSVLRGASIVRVHDVQATRRAIVIAQAILHEEK